MAIKPHIVISPFVKKILNKHIPSVNAFLKTNGSPVIEKIPGDSSHIYITFVKKENRKNVEIFLDIKGGYNDYTFDHTPLIPLPDFNLWYQSYKIDKDLCFSYRFRVAKKFLGFHFESFVTDPFNKYPKSNKNEYSVFDLSQNPVNDKPSPQLEQKGQLENFKLTSNILRNERKIFVYKPWNYNFEQEQDFPLLILTDASDFLNEFEIKKMLDELIGSGKISPLITVLISNANSNSRNLELPCYKPFAQFVTEELLPVIYSKYRISKNTKKRAVGGISFGGLCASYLALNYPDIFGKVISQSGSFWWSPMADPNPEWLIGQYLSQPKKDIEFYLEAGIQETFRIPYECKSPAFIISHRKMRDVLLHKGYKVYYEEFNGWHDNINWRKSFPKALKIMFPPKEDTVMPEKLGFSLIRKTS